MRRPLSFALIGLLSYSACVLAAEPVAGPQISLSAQARQTVANDQALAVLYAEASSANPQQVVDELNRQGQRALAIAKGYRQVRIASGNRSTWPASSISPSPLSKTASCPSRIGRRSGPAKPSPEST